MTSVYISNENIQIAVGQRRGKQLVIKSIVTEPVAEGSIINGVITDGETLKGQLANMRKEHRLPSRGLKLLIDSSSVNTKLVTLPNLSKQEYMLKLLKDSFPEDSDAVFDYKPLRPAPDGGVTVLGCMTERAFVESYIELFAGAGLRLSAIDIALDAVIRLTQFCSGLCEKTFILSLIDRNTVSLFLFSDGQYRFSNRQRVIAPRGTGEFAEELAKMLSSLVQFNRSEQSGEISDIFFCGFTDSEINLTALTLDAAMSLGRLPETPEVVFAEGAENRLSDCVLSVGNLI